MTGRLQRRNWRLLLHWREGYRADGICNIRKESVDYLEEKLWVSGFQAQHFLNERIVHSAVHIVHSRRFVTSANDLLRMQVWSQRKRRGDVVLSWLTDDSYAGIEILDRVVYDVSELRKELRWWLIERTAPLPRDDVKWRSRWPRKRAREIYAKKIRIFHSMHTLSISVPLAPGKPPPISINCTFSQPIARAIAINRLHIPMPLLNAFNSPHGLPTWKLKPYNVRPRSFVSCINCTASSSGSQPNFEPRGTGVFFESHRMRITILSWDDYGRLHNWCHTIGCKVQRDEKWYTRRNH